MTDDEPRLSGFVELVAARLGVVAPTLQVTLARGAGLKSLDTVGRICERAVEYGATRATVMVAVGGGNVGNITGLCAALLFRGIRFVQVPTTLLAMSDVVLSLKQGVNITGVKNGLGTYYAPELIWADPRTLATLSPSEIQGAQAEIIKNALTLAPEQVPVLLKMFRPDGRYRSSELTAMIDLAISAKSRVLRDDAKERNAALVLEYGHTVGHALEVLADGTLGHGFGVALGMRVAARVARLLGMLGDAEVDLHDHLLNAAGLPLGLPPALTPGVDALAGQLRRDNKRGYLRLRPSQIPMVLLSAPGVPALTDGLPLTGVDIDLVLEAYREAFSASGAAARLADSPGAR